MLASCTTTNIQSGGTLLNNEGILLTTCKTPNAINRVVTVFPENYTPGWPPPMINCSRTGNLAAIKFEKGKYYVGATNDFNEFKHLASFTLKPNKINYIGDLRIAVNETNVVSGLIAGFEQPKVNFSIMNKSEETISAFQTQYPELAGKYEIISNIPKK